MDRDRRFGGDFRKIERALAFLCHAVAFSAEAFLRHGFGPNYVGVQAAAVPAIMLAYAIPWHERNLLPLFAFLAVYVALCVEVLLGVRNAARKNASAPEHYSGHPRLSDTLFPFLSESAVKRLAEPVYVLVVGLLTRLFDEPLGTYLMATSGAMLISANLRHFRQRGSQTAPTRSAPLRVEVRRLSNERDNQPGRTPEALHAGEKA